MKRTRTWTNRDWETMTKVYEYNKKENIKNLKDKVKPTDNYNDYKSKIKELEDIIKNNADIAHTISLDKKTRKSVEEKQILEKKYKHILEENELLQKQLEIYNSLKHSEYSEFKIRATQSTKTESTAVLVMSDFHIEENVKPETVNWLNEYNLEEAEKRATAVFANGLKMIKHFEAETKIPVIVLALLWDFISWYIHEELQALNEVNPIIAVMKARDLLRWWIQYLLDNSDKQILVPCSVWNHGRWSQDKRAWQYNYSYEYMMYKTLELDFIKDKRVKFQISESYHNYMDIYWQTVRFHHWDFIKWGWGIAWITAPINNSIKRWNTIKSASLDVFGHFHQTLNWKNFVVNGSLIWATPYGMQFWNEEPSQVLFLMNSKYWKTIFTPIFVK